MDEEKNKNSILEEVTIVNAEKEIAEKFSAAVKEHFVAYSGIDNETGKKLAKGLKDIAKSKVNPKYAKSNLKQQAGFAAEAKTTARENAEKIINGKSCKTVRTDDIQKQNYGSSQIGGINDNLYDLCDVDSKGTVISDSARQLKYVGKNANDCAKKLLSPKFDKYRDSGAKFEIPAEHFDGVKKELSELSEQLKNQIESAERKGNIELAQKYKTRLKKVNQTQKNLKKGKLTTGEALEARNHPLISTAKDAAKISHEAGVQGAAIGAAIGGGMSAVNNIAAVIKGEQSGEEAVANIASDTVKYGAFGYANLYAATFIKGAMKNASNQMVRCLSKSNLPATIVTSVIEIGKTLSKLAEGKIDGTECLNELGEKGASAAMSTAAGIVSQVAIPIPVAGYIIGDIIGYVLSSVYYNSLTNALNEAKLAKEKRLQIEAECEEAIKSIKDYRNQLNNLINNYMHNNLTEFETYFNKIEKANNTGNIVDSISGINGITRHLGGETLFDSMDKFDDLMNSDGTILI